MSTSTEATRITLRRAEASVDLSIEIDGSIYIYGDSPHPTAAQIAATAPDFFALAQERAARHLKRQEREERERRHPGCTVIASVYSDDTGVGMVATAYSAATGAPVYRAADEGCTHHGGGNYPFRAAVLEAEYRARRCTSPDRIGREGYTLADYDEARRLVVGGRSLADGRKIR